MKELPSWYRPFCLGNDRKPHNYLKDVQENKCRRLQFLHAPLKEVTEICFRRDPENVRSHIKICDAFYPLSVLEQNIAQSTEAIYGCLMTRYRWLYL